MSNPAFMRKKRTIRIKENTYLTYHSTVIFHPIVETHQFRAAPGNENCV